MGDIFKVYGKNKENIQGKMRKIYGKMNKKGVLGKTKYIKYKGYFVKLSAFMKGKNEVNKAKKGGTTKGGAKSAKRSLTRLGKHKRVAVIDNISDIKDKRIRNLYLKTFKKNAKLYIFADNKRWKGGKIKYSHNKDEPILRKRNARFIHDFKVEARGMGSHARVIASPTTEIDYIHAIDDITMRMQRFGFDSPTSKMFEGINNLKYTIRDSGGGITYYIRPSIEFVPYDKVIIYFYITKKGGFSQVTPASTSTPINTDKKWIRMSIHITIFLKMMTEVVIEDSQYKLFSGHLHITSEKENNTRYNIKTTLNGSNSTHTYLLGDDMGEMVKIMETMGGDIFKAWSFNNSAPSVTDKEKALKLTLYEPYNNMWGEYRNDCESLRLLLTNDEKKHIFDNCFKNLRYIYCNIFHILKTDTFPSTVDIHCLPEGVISVQKITKPTPGVTTPGVTSTNTDTYLEYKVPNSASYNNKINLSYVIHTGIINVNDLKKRKDAPFKPMSHIETHNSGPLYSRSPPVALSGEHRRSPPRGLPRERMRAMSADIPRERMRSPPRGLSGEHRRSPPRGLPRGLPRELPREPIRPIETRGEKRNAELPFWERAVRRRGLFVN